MATLHVDPSATGAFRNISSALDRSAAGDTILVTGTYQENLVIPHALEMRAETTGQRFTLLGSITVSTPGVRFVLKDCEVKNSAQSGLTVSDAQAVVTACVLSFNSKSGIHVLENGSVVATQCTFNQNGEVGVFLFPSSTARLERCLSSENGQSGVAVGSNASVAIMGSDLAHNVGNGLWLNPNAKATIQQGAIYGNKSDGIQAKSGQLEVRACKIHSGLAAGVHLEEISTATIEECEVSGNAGCGININLAEAVVRGNKIYDNGENGIFIQNGGQATIENCEMWGGGQDYPGITVNGSKASIRYCQVHDTNSVGIQFRDAAKGVIERSHCWKNAEDGIRVVSGSEVQARHTKSTENTQRGFQVSSAELTLEGCEIWGGGKEFPGILAAGAKLLIRNTGVHDANGHGMILEDQTTGVVEDCDLWRNVGTGICIRTKSEVQVRRSKSHSNNEYGILIQDGSNGTIEECECWGGGQDYSGITVIEARALVRNCRVHHTKLNGIWFHSQASGVIEQSECWSNAASGIRVEAQSEALIRASKAHENGQNGIFIVTSANGTIEDCECWGGGENYPGIAIANATALVRNCRVHDIESQGISFREQAKGTIEACTIWSSKIGGIGVGLNADTVIRGCTVRQNTECGVWVYDNSKSKIVHCTIIENLGPGVLVQNSKVDVIGGAVKGNTGFGFKFREHASTSVSKDCLIQGNSEGPYFNDGTASVTLPDSPLQESTQIKSAAPPKKVAADKTESEQATAELDQLVGLQEVKNAMRDLKALLTLEKGDISRLDGLHCLFLGGPGTGKTSVARLMGKILHSMDATQTDKVIVVDRPRQQLVAPYIGQSADRTQKIIEQAIGGVLFIDEAYSLVQKDGGGNDYGSEVIDTLVPALENHRHELVVIAAGYPARMNDFLGSNPGLKGRFRRRFIFEDYKPDELMQIFSRMLQGRDLNIEEEARMVVEQEFTARYEARDEEFDNARMVRNFIADAHQSLARRLVGIGSIEKPGEATRTLTRADVAPLCTSIPPDPRPDDEIMAELNQLVGLSKLKKNITDVINTIRFEQLTADPSTGFEPPRLHSLFLGSPGTGKTTVARLMGQLYRNMRLLSRGHVVDGRSSELKAEYLGQTGPKVRRKIKEALGGILFLDEAYDLVSGEQDSFGREALTVIMTEMENRKPGQFVVIAAGYQKEMLTFLESNAGLINRFPPRFRFDFDDYAPQELLQIFEKFIAEKKLSCGPGVQERALKEFEAAWHQRGTRFANGRAVRNYFEEVVSKLAARATKLPQGTPMGVLRTIAAEDLEGLNLDRGNTSSHNQGKKFGFTP